MGTLPSFAALIFGALEATAISVEGRVQRKGSLCCIKSARIDDRYIGVLSCTGAIATENFRHTTIVVFCIVNVSQDNPRVLRIELPSPRNGSGQVHTML